MYLILVDAHSKWLEVRQTNTATSSVTITHLRSIFSVHGLPEVVVIDNGTVFTSAEFEEYLKLNGIRHIRTAPYHPASNGQAERAVKIFKQHIKTNSGSTTPAELERFLFRYRLTPHTTTGVSPAELLFGRRPRSHLDLARPDLQREIQQKQLMQQAKRGGKAEREFVVKSKVWAKVFDNSKTPWLPGVVQRSCGPKSYLVELLDGRVIRRHVDHLRERVADMTETVSDEDDDWLYNSATPVQDSAEVTRQPHLPPQSRRSSRMVRPPDRYGFPPPN